MSTADQANKVHVIINEKTILEYDREKENGQEQLDFFNHINQRIEDNGITFAGTHYNNPEMPIRAQAVAQDMIIQLLNREYDKASAMFAWLGYHLPSLRSVLATVENDQAQVHLKFQGAAA